jgi:hypothetical protein
MQAKDTISLGMKVQNGTVADPLRNIEAFKMDLSPVNNQEEF